MKNTMTRIFLLAAALVLAMSLCLVHAEEAAPVEETEVVSTPAYIFWQDQDWWPAASNKTDDYWTPTPAMVTGEGFYTVKLDAHMPSWFYSGGNSNIGAQKLAVVITDGQTLFPDMFMQIVDVRIDGVSYPCGDVTYGQTGYENAAEDGSLFWGANDTYGLIWDQWMIDNAGTVGTGNTWSSTATAQKFDVFDVSLLNNPSSIEIDFFLSAQQDVRPEGGPALRVIGEGPFVEGDRKTVLETMEIPENTTTASVFYLAGGWWPVTDGALGVSNPTTILGEGKYTITSNFTDQGGWVPSGNGAEKLLLVVDNGKNGEGTIMDGMYLGVTDVRVNGNSIPLGTAAYGPTGYDSDHNGYKIFDSNDGYSILYDSWMANNQTELPWGHETWDGSAGELAPVNPDDLKNVTKVEVDIIVTDTQGQLPEEPNYDFQWYPNNTMGVAGYSLRDLGIGNKWYNVVPVDMTKNGIYKIPLVASNLYVIGNAIVTVDDQNVTVDYETQWASPGNLTINSECVAWFDEIADITAEFAENPQSELAFGEPMSKAELGNVGYLFICNGLTYCQPIADNGIFLARYNHNHVIWEAYRAGLDAMVAELEPVVEAEEEVVPSPDAEIVASPDAELVPSPEAE